MTATFCVTGARILAGKAFEDGKALLVRDGRIEAVLGEASVPDNVRRVPAHGALLVPGFVDLQVNGGGGVLLNNAPTLEGIAAICAAHAGFGTTSLLPTLITDRPEIRDAAVEAGKQALAAGVPGFLGLHLEGPHLSLARKGTHDPALIRPMTEADLAYLTREARDVGLRLITIAPESVSEDQVRALVSAGYVVSLGHTDVGAQTAAAYFAAGATMVTHLFNAMSPLGHREPGVVGAALDAGGVSCGLIADGFHVDPVAMGIALRAKRGPGRIFLVTDAMSTIGSNEQGFELNGRQVYRRDGRLTLADGTLAGADIDMLSSVRFVHERLSLPLEDALAMASLYPAEACGATTKGRIAAGCDADFLLLTPELSLLSTWIGGRCVFHATTRGLPA
ncbi:N-acetylglucosamine 6-phosphate deacetylase [Rhizobium sp. RU20A]|uniref:N-acetylglucosamine-6-phosphate deacetylase n=1 Tax=Rhizobium sp. RU20A TaxID=1907412 RepID=UPI000954EBBB|nr:N-acetylglucosamine-6-phosphate deacetylase [Rhizobium sp. RU20A]SIR18254.1 N-acetylglucosamine 6-phosphate deacetylase [Rhizobium sp. RU20A]